MEDLQTNRQTDRQTDRQRQMRELEREIEREGGGDGETCRQADRKTYRPTGRLPDKHTGSEAEEQWSCRRKKCYGICTPWQAALCIGTKKEMQN